MIYRDCGLVDCPVYLDSMRGTLGLLVPGPVGLHLIV